MLNSMKAVLGLSAALLLSQPALADWKHLNINDVDIDIVSDNYRRALPEYPVKQKKRTYRAYLEAYQGTEYSIRVRNRSGERIGLVIAVDGRNIISGKRSKLRPKERMYILNPHQEATYKGWRSGKNHINRFYFTDAPDSYAGRWGDYSAMGVIAVAAFAEDRPYYQEHYERRNDNKRNGRAAKPSLRGAPQSRSYSNEPGTGYGDRDWSPSRRVDFDPHRKPFARYFLKYEWRETLCKKGIIRCHRERYSERRHNRMWNEDRYDYARPPPGVTYWRHNDRRD